MGQRRTGGITAHERESEMRDAEVLRANRELAAYFKGRRTEREARAALKIVKAFVRDRERRDAKSRRPLPGCAPPKPLAAGTAKKSPASRKVAPAKTTRKPDRKSHGPKLTASAVGAPNGVSRDKTLSEPDTI